MSFADLTLGVLQYLGSKNGVQDIVLEERKPAARHELFLWEQKTFCSLPDDMRSFYLASNGFNLTWSAKLDTSVIPVGKMWLNTIQNVTRVGTSVSDSQSGPSLADLESDTDSDVDDDTTDALVDRRQRLTPSFNFHKCHLFELDSCSGLGKVCLVYHHREPSGKPNVWFVDRALRWHYLAESFSAYYRLMLVHLGLPQWQYAFTDIGLSSQGKQWFHIFAPVRLELNHDILSSKSHTDLPDNTELEHNKLESDRLFQMNRGTRKKIASSNSSTTVSSGVSQTSSTQSNTASSLARKKIPLTYTQKTTAPVSKFNGSNAFLANRLTQMK